MDIICIFITLYKLRKYLKKKHLFYKRTYKIEHIESTYRKEKTDFGRYFAVSNDFELEYSPHGKGKTSMSFEIRKSSSSADYESDVL